jgi:hypothetical protein
VFDLLLNATKLLVSDDARKTASSLLEAVRRSPEWKHDVCELSDRIDKRFREQASLVSAVAGEKLGPVNPTIAPGRRDAASATR